MDDSKVVVYVIEGYNPRYHVAGVFSSREKAEEVIKTFPELKYTIFEATIDQFYSSIDENGKVTEYWVKKDDEDLLLMKKEGLNKAVKIADLLRKKYGVTKVYLFGSMLEGREIWWRSDINIMAEGFVDNERYWEMYTNCIDLGCPIDVDVVLKEELNEERLSLIYEEAKLL